MANTKTTKATKPVTETEIIEDTVKETKVVENTAKEVKPVVKEEVIKEYKPDDMIRCVSVTAGELMMIGKKTNALYRWENYGDTAYVEFQDLKAEVHNAKSPFIYSPLFMVDDEDVLKLSDFSKVNDIYRNAISIDEIDSFFSLSDQQFSSQLKKLPVGIKETIKSIAVDKLEDGSLDSIRKIKIMDSVLGTDLYNLLGR